MTRKINALFISTSSSAVAYWRIQNFVQAAWRTGLASFQHPLWIKDWNHIAAWQEKITSGPKYDPMYIRAFVPMVESGCAQADVVVFQYGHEEGALELFDSIRIKFPNLPVLVEIDDNVLAVPIYNAAFRTYDPRSEIRRRAVQMMRTADGVIVSTPYLKEIYAEFSSNIWVVQNCLDFRIWDRLKRRSRPGVRIGWAGGDGHEGDFLGICGALKRILKKYADARLVLVNGPARNGVPEPLQGLSQVEYHAPSEWVPVMKYPKMLANLDFDIGIAPLIDSAFNRGKSNLKWLENSALGIPTVASNVGHYAETLRSGRDCVLADDEHGFELALDILIADRRRRRAIGAAAQERARRDFNVDNVVQDYVAFLKEAIGIKARTIAAAEVPATDTVLQEATA